MSTTRARHTFLDDLLSNHVTAASLTRSHQFSTLVSTEHQNKSMAKKRKRSKKPKKVDPEYLQSQRAGSKRLLDELHYKGPSKNSNGETRSGQNDRTRATGGGNEDTVKLVNTHDRLDIPRSFVVKNGKVNKNLQTLVMDLRKLMSPYTALSLKDGSKANLKDYAAVAGHVGVFLLDTYVDVETCVLVEGESHHGGV